MSFVTSHTYSTEGLLSTVTVTETVTVTKKLSRAPLFAFIIIYFYEKDPDYFLTFHSWLQVEQTFFVIYRMKHLSITRV